jgi:hypothetical protein
MYPIFFLCFTEGTVRIYVILTEFVPIKAKMEKSCKLNHKEILDGKTKRGNIWKNNPTIYEL